MCTNAHKKKEKKKQVVHFVQSRSVHLYYMWYLSKQCKDEIKIAKFILFMSLTVLQFTWGESIIFRFIFICLFWSYIKHLFCRRVVAMYWELVSKKYTRAYLIFCVIVPIQSSGIYYVIDILLGGIFIRFLDMRINWFICTKFEI